MDRRQRKVEAKRKKRDLAKKRAQALAAARPSALERAMSSAARAPFGPCAVSNGWNDEAEPEIVSVAVTRALPNGDLLPVIALVDRTCLGIKNAIVYDPIAPGDLDDLLTHVGTPHEGMEACEALVAQSIVFHALDYARRLGFEPHPDFHEELFGPRPAELLATPFCARKRPMYVPGPHDDVIQIARQLFATVGADNFDFVSEFEDGDDDFEDDDDESAA